MDMQGVSHKLLAEKNPINSKFLHVIHINLWISGRIKP